MSDESAPISPEQFCIFLRGMFSFHDASQAHKTKATPARFNEAQTAMIRKELDRVKFDYYDKGTP